MHKQRRRSASLRGYQIRGNREADQRLCFRHMDSAIPLLSKSEISSLYPSSVTIFLISTVMAQSDNRHCYQRVQPRMVLVVNIFVFLKSLFSVLVLPYLT